MNKTTTNADKILEDIVQERFEFTLERQGSDSLDFHDISVWGLKEVMLKAYEAGLAASKNKEKAVR